MEIVHTRMRLNLNSMKGASKIISLVVVGLILSALTLGLVYPKTLQNRDTINDESDNQETPSISETSADSERARSVIEVLSKNITEWHYFYSDYRYYQIQFRIKNIGDEDLEIEYIMVDTFLTTVKNTEETQELIKSKALEISEYETYFTESSQNKIIPFGEETSINIYTENLQNKTEHTIRLHFTENEDYTFNITNGTNIVKYPICAKFYILNCFSTKDAYGNWTVEMRLVNSGTVPVTLTSIFINDIEIDIYNTTAVTGELTSDMTTSYSLAADMSETVNVYISSSASTKSVPIFNSGMTILISVHSASGMEYSKYLQLL